MNTIENNKLIAEFMGLELEETLEGLFVYARKEQSPIKLNDIRTEFYEVHELKYHALWDDWLMPVVDRILDISFQDEGDPEDFYSIRDCIPDRNHTYKAVVEFIKEYNKTKED
jgi:hypothetical protein